MKSAASNPAKNGGRCGESRASHRIPLEPEAPKQEHEVAFLENFFDELRRKVPTGK
jgi:hypothetical protein